MSSSENKKIINASTQEFGDIQFKSKLEIMIYKTLVEYGFTPKYEEVKFLLWEGFKPSVPFYNKDKKSKDLKLDNKKLIDITYTPDFTFEYNDTLIIIEAKGFENDVFPVKKKLFRGLLERLSKAGKNIIYFEIFTKKQLIQAINIIKNVTESNRED